jgi:beta propeller repeat protein
MKTMTCGALAALLLIGGGSLAGTWEAFVVYPDPLEQLHPDVDGGKVLWQQKVEYNGAYDWEIFGADLMDENTPYPIYVTWLEANQTRPAISGDYVVWEDDTWGADDIDVHLTSIADPANPTDVLITNFTGDQARPAIHGNTVVWQDLYTDSAGGVQDWDIYMADVTDPNNPQIYPTAYLTGDQSEPAIYRAQAVWQDAYDGQVNIEGADLWRRNRPDLRTVSASSLEQRSPAIHGDTVVWQENFGGNDWDIYAADLSDPDNPIEFPLVSDPAAQTSPDVYGHIAVWQDYRNGNWDIYGFNLITRREFQITSNAADQTNPAIWENLVVWEDNRSGVSAIWAAWLDGPELADCTVVPAGDTNGDCRVNLEDFAALAETWLVCGLEPLEACSR